MMTFDEALERLAATGPELRVGRAADGSLLPPRKFTLDHIRALLAELGDPQRRFASVLIAGTNGKGSTAATLAAITTAAGLRTGLYTSPHLLRITERICTSGPGGISAPGGTSGLGGISAPGGTATADGISAPGGIATPASPAVHAGLIEIPDAAFGRCFGAADAAALRLIEARTLPHYPSFFEILTATAFLYFAEAGIALAVLEVGLGGRLDATNAVEPLVSVLTDIGIDHTEYLGHTLTEIATEKAGILRPDGVLVTLSQHPEANAAIGAAAVRLGVRGVDAARCLPGTFARSPSPSTSPYNAPPADTGDASPLPRNRYDLSIEGEVLHVDSPLAGQHQQRNLALAVATAIELRTNHGFAIPNAAIERGLRETVWPGRLEWVPSRHGHAPLLLDVAHNPAGAWTLRAALAQLPGHLPRTLLFSCLADKQIDEMAQVLLPLFDSTSGDPDRAHDHVVLAPIQNPRAATVDELLAAAHRLDVPAHAAPHLAAALAQAEAVTPPHGLIVVTGSVYLIGEMRTLVLAEPR